MVEVLLRALFIVLGLGVTGWLLVVAKAFRTNFSSFTEREAKHGEIKPIDPANKDKILV